MNTIKKMAIVVVALVSGSISLFGRQTPSTTTSGRGSVSTVPGRGPITNMPDKEPITKEPITNVSPNPEMIAMHREIMGSLNDLKGLANRVLSNIEVDEIIALRKEYIQVLSPELTELFISYLTKAQILSEQKTSNMQQNNVQAQNEKLKAITGSLAAKLKAGNYTGGALYDNRSIFNELDTFIENNSEVMKSNKEIARLFKNTLTNGLKMFGVSSADVNAINSNTFNKYL
jgi:hypothetical protein